MSENEVPIRRGHIDKESVFYEERLLPSEFRPRPEMLAAVEKVVAKAFNLSGTGLRVPGREIIHVWPRQVAMYFMRETTSATSVEVADWFGMDKGTVTHARVKVRDFLKIYPALRVELDAIEVRIRQRLSLLAERPPAPSSPHTAP